VDYACERAYNWFKILNKSTALETQKMRELYTDLTSCEELTEYED